MTNLVPASDIERIVGTHRRNTDHIARAVSDEQTVYILHSHQCKDRRDDLRDCPFSRALDNGINLDEWAESMDRPVSVGIREDVIGRPRLVPANKAFGGA